MFQEYITTPGKGADHQQTGGEKRYLGDGVVVANRVRFLIQKGGN